MVTINDVAELAGVSKSTVSNVLNKSATVKESTKNRVLLAVKTLNFIPSSNAKNLKASCCNEVGVILADVNDSINRDILNGVCTAMQRAGYFVNIAFSNGIARLEQEKIRMLFSKRIAGLIILTCQDENSPFFREEFLQNKVPVYFVLRKPQNIACNFAVFDSHQIVHDITSQMLALGYRDISLVCGNNTYTNEKAAIEGFTSAYSERSLHLMQDRICKTLLTKEDAFKTTIMSYQNNMPEAIIATSSTIVKGVVETAFLLSQTIGEDITVVCLGDEGWCRANQINSVIITNSNAVQLGERTADSLLQIINSHCDNKNDAIIIKDTFNTQLIPPPVNKPKKIRLIKGTNTLNILASPLHSTEALNIISRYFESINSNTKVNIRIADEPGMVLKKIEEENQSGKCLNDLYIYDSTCLHYIAHNKLLLDISEYVNRTGQNISRILDRYLNSCQYEDKYYGIPFFAYCQLLLYRRDIFEDQAIQKHYKRKYGMSFHIPRTWIEYNRIGEYFTSSINPNSPVKYGVSLSTATPEQVIHLVLPYLWSFKADLFDKNFHPGLSSKPFIKGVEEFLKTISYSNPNYKKITPHDTIHDLLDGTCAMIISSSKDISSLNPLHRLDERLGFTSLPGQNSIFSSLNFGVSKYASNFETIYNFLDWVTSPTVDYYLAILSGQSTTLEPYQNNELKRIYPWMDMLQQTSTSARKRLPPLQKGARIIPQNKIDGIIANLFYDIIYYGSNLQASIQKAQYAMEQLFLEYGILGST